MEYAVVNSGNGCIIHRPITKEKAEEYSKIWNKTRSDGQCITKVVKITDVKNAYNYKIITD